jgi:hypothetical protein
VSEFRLYTSPVASFFQVELLIELEAPFDFTIEVEILVGVPYSFKVALDLLVLQEVRAQLIR